MLPKPKSCEQKWLDMKPVEGGRLCGKCNKLIVDFTKTPMKKIFRIKMESPAPVCGMYTKKQLKNWGKPETSKKSCSKAFLLVSSMFAAIHADAEPTTIETAKTEQQYVDIFQNQSRQDSIPKSAQDTVKPVIISGIVKSADTEELLFGVSIWVKGTEIGAVTNVKGAFQLQLPESLDSLEDKTLSIAYTGYSTIHVDLTRHIRQNLLFEMEEGAMLTDFGVRRPNLFQRIWIGIKNIFRKKN